ncbi:MAG TPA: hypothetical protein VJ784_08645 [Pyrinomonadaceae bacterium]|nr:hypothetical protein [Pyrinomonadaceae bacterium]
MKACPRCDLVYKYESLKYCRFDGTRLVNMYNSEETTQLLTPTPISNQNTGALAKHRTGELQNRAR